MGYLNKQQRPHITAPFADLQLAQVTVPLPSRPLPQLQSLEGVAMTKSVDPGAAVAAVVVEEAAAARVRISRVLRSGRKGEGPSERQNKQ